MLGFVLCLLSGCAAPSSPLAPKRAPDPTPVYSPLTLPKDEAPHQDLTEWWYYTGHLQADDGRQYGFEVVTFQAIRGDYPVAYAAHFAVTDHARGAFWYRERASFGPRTGSTAGFDLRVGDWRMRGLDGHDELSATTPEYAIQLRLDAQKPPVLHDEDGIASFGAAGVSYYYSRTRMSVEGTLLDHGTLVNVRGLAWFDRQWGNFLVLEGGWDWFSVILDDDAELMLNVIRDEDRDVALVYGTYVAPDGAFRHLTSDQISIEPGGQWTSPHTGATYPSGWRVSVSQPDYRLEVTPVLKDQELAGTTSSSVTYWEGESTVAGTRDGQPVKGMAYVELTGYTPR
ncbi:MAG: carotenoid 1,2-hydratase [Chloroflexi bacterium]|nr:carotenoid 1,2-hydratase [Chloroflexota bacterium]